MEQRKWNVDLKKENINEALLLKREIEVYQKRLDAMDEHEDTVRPTVFNKVKQDYIDKLSELEKHFSDIRKRLLKEASSIAKERRSCERELQEVDERMEELQFRYDLGELNDEQFKGPEQERQKEIEVLNDVLNKLNKNMTHYIDLLGEEAVEKLQKDKVQIVKKGKKKTKDNLRFVANESEQAASEEAEDIDEKTAQKVSDEDSQFRPIEDISDQEDSVVEVDDEELQAESAPQLEEGDESQVDEIPASVDKDSALDINGGPRLLVHSPDGSTENFEINDHKLSIGRVMDNDVVLSAKSVSRHHADVIKEGKGYIIRDLKSSNGTYVNDERIDEHSLANGDEIRIGNWRIEFQNT